MAPLSILGLFLLLASQPLVEAQMVMMGSFMQPRMNEDDPTPAETLMAQMRPIQRGKLLRESAMQNREKYRMIMQQGAQQDEMMRPGMTAQEMYERYEAGMSEEERRLLHTQLDERARLEAMNDKARALPMNSEDQDMPEQELSMYGHQSGMNEGMMNSMMYDMDVNTKSNDGQRLTDDSGDEMRNMDMYSQNGMNNQNMYGGQMNQNMYAQSGNSQADMYQMQGDNK